jgi:hypothetical protein
MLSSPVGDWDLVRIVLDKVRVILSSPVGLRVRLVVQVREKVGSESVSEFDAVVVLERKPSLARYSARASTKMMVEVGARDDKKMHSRATAKE